MPLSTVMPSGTTAYPRCATSQSRPCSRTKTDGIAPATASYSASTAESIARTGSSSTSIRAVAATAAAASSPASIGRTTRAAVEPRSMTRISAGARAIWSRGRRAPLRAQSAVPVENRVPPEERDHATESEKRAERDRLLPGLTPVAHKQHQRGHERDEEPHEHGDDD